MKRKIFFYSLGLFVGLAVLVASQSPNDKARMVACDVGQGDAILITKGSNQVLVDGGPSGEKILSCLAKYLPFWDRNIELIVLTNTDYDHMNGLATVIERYSVTKFVTADGVHESEAFTHLLAALQEKGLEVTGVEQGESIRMGERQPLAFQVLWPPKVEQQYIDIVFNNEHRPKADQPLAEILGASAKRGDLNERSVVLLWDEGGYKTLLTGDAGDQAEKEMLSEGILSDVDVLKVGHHGSKYASTLEFLQKIKPEIAVISVGAKNSYGHPTPETLERLRRVGAQIRRTDQQGDIEIMIP